MHTSDIRRLNSKAVFAKSTGMIILGGGLVKHHIANANLMVNAWTQKHNHLELRCFSHLFLSLSEEWSWLCSVCQHWSGVWRLGFRRSARWSRFLGENPHGRLTCKGEIKSWIIWRQTLSNMIWLTVVLCLCAGLCWCLYSLSAFSGWNFCTQRQQVDQGKEEWLMVLFSC